MFLNRMAAETKHDLVLFRITSRIKKIYRVIVPW